LQGCPRCRRIVDLNQQYCAIVAHEPAGFVQVNAFSCKAIGDRPKRAGFVWHLDCQYFKKDRFASRNNIELLEAGNGSAKAKMTLHPHHWNSLGTVHGGAVFTLADFALAAACNSHGTVAVAIDANITFMKASTAGTLFDKAREVSKNFKLGSYAVEIRNEHSELIARFQGLAYRKNDKLPFST
jgi:acyl-CoA thioesterase